MKLAQSRITGQGQISVPAEVRKRLAVGPGAVLEWDAEGDRIVIRRVGSHDSDEVHRALFRTTPEVRSLDALKAGPRRHARARHARR